MELPSNSPLRADSAEGMFVERALTWIENTTYNVLTPPLEGRMYVPVDNSTPAGAKMTAYKQYTRTGIAKLVTERGGDMPTSGLFVKEFHHQFYRLGMSYEYTLDDLLASMMATQNGSPPVNLDLELSLGCQEGIEKGLDQISAVGSVAPGTVAGLNSIGPDVGMLGLLNQTNASTYTVALGATGSQAWSTKTPDEVVRDLTGIFKAQVAGTYKVHTPDTILTPIDQGEDIAGRRMGDGSDTTIRSFFLGMNKRVTALDTWQMCSGQGSGGSDRMVAYKRQARFIRHMISQEFFQMPAQFENFEYSVLCTAKTAGCVSPFPLSLTYADNI